VALKSDGLIVFVDDRSATPPRSMSVAHVQGFRPQMVAPSAGGIEALEAIREGGIIPAVLL
jgi:hypothetical protein